MALLLPCCAMVHHCNFPRNLGTQFWKLSLFFPLPVYNIYFPTAPRALTGPAWLGAMPSARRGYQGVAEEDVDSTANSSGDDDGSSTARLVVPVEAAAAAAAPSPTAAAAAAAGEGGSSSLSLRAVSRTTQLSVAFSALGGILFGMDLANWAGASNQRDFLRVFCLDAGYGSEQACLAGTAQELPTGFAVAVGNMSAMLQVGAALSGLALAPWLAPMLAP